jgi:hypothetical protein
VGLALPTYCCSSVAFVSCLTVNEVAPVANQGHVVCEGASSLLARELAEKTNYRVLA